MLASRRVIDLSDHPWTFAGYIGEDWRYRNAFVTQEPSRQWHAGSVPGSVHWDLIRSGDLDDPYFGRQSLNAEWVPQRQWVYRTTVRTPPDWSGSRVFLEVDGTDYEADVFLDGIQLGTSRSLFTTTRFDIGEQPDEVPLVIVLHAAPPEQSQIGHTSRVTTHKPRMGYGWDFAPRLVAQGIHGAVRLVCTDAVRVDDLWVHSTLATDRTSASIDVAVELDGSSPTTELQVTVECDGATIAENTVSVDASAASAVVSISIDEPKLWWPQGLGDQPLYSCRVDALVDGAVSDTRTTTFGIRDLQVIGNDAPASDPEALGYTVEVNGHRTFVRGWNWVPVDAMYSRADLGERYEDLIALAVGANVNMLRVWGGGLIERELFYDLCDHAGILVWQEFVQSSSGLDNDPPSTDTYLGTLVAEARQIVKSRRNHPSLAVWCGGNELSTDDGPVGLDHPNIAALHAVVDELDPARAFLPSSPSGPVFYLSEEAIATRPDDLHDVHGPWDYLGPVASYSIYNNSPALLHSEFGTPGALARASLNRFADDEAQWPPDDSNPLWIHHGSWWLQRHWIEAVFGPVDNIDDYLLLSQWLQADLLGFASDSNRRRWPICSGSIPWQFNEPWPNAHCTSAVDYYLRPKAAYWAVRDAYAPVAVSLRHDGQAVAGSLVRGTIHICADDDVAGSVEVTVFALDGQILDRSSHPFRGRGSVAVGEVELDFDALGATLVMVRVEGIVDGGSTGRRHYVFTSAAETDTPLAALYRAPKAELECRAEAGVLRVRNVGSTPALWPGVDVDDDSVRWLLSDNFPVLLPDEEWSTEITARRRRQPLGPHQATYRAGAGEPDAVEVTVRGWNIATTNVSVPLQ